MIQAIKQFFGRHIEPFHDSRGSAGSERALELATAVLLVEVSRADDEVAPAERRAIISALENVFDLDERATLDLMEIAEQEADHSTSLYGFTHLLNERFSRTDKETIVEMLWRVAYADGRIDKYEDYYVRKIADLLYVSHKDFIRTKHRVISGATRGRTT